MNIKTNRMSYTPLVPYALLILIASLFFSCSKKAEPVKGYEIIRFIYGPIAMNLPLFAACDNGYFEKRGIKMEMTNFQNTQKLSSPAIEAGEIDGAAISFINMTLSRQQGYHAKLIASWGCGGPGFEQTALVTLKDSPIKTITDLSGQTIGGFLKSTEFGMQQQQLFEKHGITNCNHIELPIAQTVGALRSGRIVAAQLIEPQLAMLKDEIRVLALYDEADARGYGFSEKMCNEKPELLRKWVEALQEGVVFVLHNEDSSRVILAKWTNIPPAVAKIVPLPAWDIQCRIIEDGAIRSLAWMEKQNLLTKKMSLDELCDFRFCGKITSREILETWKKEKSINK